MHVKYSWREKKKVHSLPHKSLRSQSFEHIVLVVKLFSTMLTD